MALLCCPLGSHCPVHARPRGLGQEPLPSTGPGQRGTEPAPPALLSLPRGSTPTQCQAGTPTLGNPPGGAGGGRVSGGAPAHLSSRPPGPVWGPPRSCGQDEVGVRTAAWAPASPGRLSPQYHEAPGSIREWSGRASLAPGSAHAPGAVPTPTARVRALGAACSPLLLSRVPGNGFSPTSWRWKTPLTSSSRGPRRWTSSGKAWSGGGVPGVSRSGVTLKRSGRKPCGSGIQKGLTSAGLGPTRSGPAGAGTAGQACPPPGCVVAPERPLWDLDV